MSTRFDKPLICNDIVYDSIYILCCTFASYTIYIQSLHCSVFQLLDRIEMGTFVWWEGPTIGREEWRCSGMEHGELSVTLNGAQQMLMSCVNN